MISVQVWTWDYGRLNLTSRDTPQRRGWVISKLINHGLWKEFRKIPRRWVENALPYLDCPLFTKRFIRLYLAAH